MSQLFVGQRLAYQQALHFGEHTIPFVVIDNKTTRITNVLRGDIASVWAMGYEDYHARGR